MRAINGQYRAKIDGTIVGFECKLNPMAIKFSKSLLVAVFIAIFVHGLFFMIFKVRSGSEVSREAKPVIDIRLLVGSNRMADTVEAKNPVASRQIDEGPSKATPSQSPKIVDSIAKPAGPISDPEANKTGVSRPITAGLLSQQIAEVSASINQHRETEISQRHIRFLSDIKEHREVAAAYEQAWQVKIERIGNLNYPDEARRQGLSGSLLLAVAINKDGSVYSVQILQSSGQSVLDAAAKKIIELSAPFADLPEELQSEADILVITRTWRFNGDYHFETRSH